MEIKKTSMENMVKKILITGIKGYLGPVVHEFLSKKKEFDIYGIDNYYFEKKKKEKKILIKDIRKISKKDLNGFDSVIHLAAISNDPMGKEFKKPTKEINFDASKKLLRLCIQQKMKNFIFASSCSIYGDGGRSFKKETHSVNPLTDYAKSKINFEKFCKRINLRSTKVTCLRFGTAMGGSSNIRLDLVLNDLIGKAMTIGKIRMVSDGSPLRPLIHVKDMALAMYWALKERKKNKKKFLIINVGTNSMNFSIKQIAQRVKKYHKKAEIEFGKKSPDKRSYKVDFSLYRSLAKKYLPKYNLDKSIEEITHCLKKIGISKLKKNYNNYMRLNSLNILKDKKKISKHLSWL